MSHPVLSRGSKTQQAESQWGDMDSSEKTETATANDADANGATGTATRTSSLGNSSNNASRILAKDSPLVKIPELVSEVDSDAGNPSRVDQVPIPKPEKLKNKKRRTKQSVDTVTLVHYDYKYDHSPEEPIFNIQPTILIRDGPENQTSRNRYVYDRHQTLKFLDKKI